LGAGHAVGHDERLSFIAQGLTRDHWANASPVRQIFRTAFNRTGLPYVKPHTVRNTLTQFAYKLQLNPEQLKAWSQNMGHDSVLTTIGSYGPVSVERQGEIIGALGQPNETTLDLSTEIAQKVAALLKGG
jgi:hypothetical protein